MDLHTPIVLARFQVNYKHICSYQDDILLVEDCFRLLAQQRQEPGRLFALLSIMVDICLRAFRKDVLAIMRPVIRLNFKILLIPGMWHSASLLCNKSS
ncbi:uncharacterized protein BDW70DRAFT_144876 [Aspergillus foveolatus]|uniref:uncharacterized protein n=1 Tax=Aspergillus foveolatus TaxID=210207 RepID=UPI003CCE5389